MSTANDLDPVWADARAILADAFHTDTYEIWRPTDASNGRGGNAKTLAQIESGDCVLRVDTNRSGQRVSSDLVVTTTAYVAELPIASMLMTTDTLKVNGRTFDVQDVKRGGEWGLFTQVQMVEHMP
ncbi:MAG TPA: hypothetical protein VFQ54_01215 [Thermomicrobiales bacterium]|nr:hypothetical protein [Thermomicrobiales bacterium]